MVAYLSLSRLDYCLAGAMLFAETVSNAGSLEYAKVWSVCAILVWAYLGWENRDCSISTALMLG